MGSVHRQIGISRHSSHLIKVLLISFAATCISIVYVYTYAFGEIDDVQTITDKSLNTFQQYEQEMEGGKKLHSLTEIFPLDYESCLGNESVPENWCFDANKVPRYVGMMNWPPKTVKHYTYAGYEKCLAGKTIVFIGDSRVRYQFMHLAGYLNTKRWMKCEDYHALNNSIQSEPECYLINERLGSDWISWFKNTTEMLNHDEGSRKQSSLCDCFREPAFQPSTSYENRFIKRSTPYGEINLIYLQNFENRIRMDKEFPPFAPFDQTPKRCKTGECGMDVRVDEFDGNTNETLWNIVPKLGATHAFVNRGWEYSCTFEDISDFSCTIREFERQNKDIKVYLITHPPDKIYFADPSAKFDVKKLKCNSDVLDRTSTNKNIPHSWYWDDLHALSILNEEYNHQLVEKICPLPGDF